MNNLALYYKNSENDYEKAKKYYKMAVVKGSVLAMANLAIFYQDVEKDYESAKKYYKLAIDLEDIPACNDLANFYQDVEKNYEKEVKYRQMYLRKNRGLQRKEFPYYVLAKNRIMAKKKI
jgi:TPR repeat protein